MGEPLAREFPRCTEGDGAVISDDGDYRYLLWRTWAADRPVIAFVMLNPSTADDRTNDPTIRRCIEFAERWGYGSLLVGNLFALRSPDPDRLYRHSAPVGPENDRYLIRLSETAETVVAAWGARGGFMDRSREVLSLLSRRLYALDTTKAGEPVHPLYQPADSEPERFEPTGG